MRRVIPWVLIGMATAASVGQDKPPNPPAAAKSSEPKETPAGAKVTAATATSPLEFTMKSIDGKDVPLSKYKGKVVLIVNVASKCGLTAQYAQLQELHQKFGSRGLAVIGFPANNFGNQEPGSEPEIREFCTKNYGVTFDMFAKVSVKGEDQSELYRFLTTESKANKFPGEIEWNFAKFLVDRDGQVIARFSPKVRPDDKEVLAAIEKALEAKPADEKK